MPKRKQISTRTRFEIFKRDSFTCQYCGRKPPQVVLHADHILPVSKGGKSEWVNYVTSCVDCNLGKSDKLLTQKVPSLESVRELEMERFSQMKALNKWLGEKRRTEDEWFRQISAFWITLEGQDPKEWKISGHRAETVRMFMKRMPYQEIIESLEIASYKKDAGTHGFLKYFCGVCWHKIKGDLPV